MFTCLRISDAASMALHAVDILARSAGRLASNQDIADVLGVSANHLSKVHQRLARAGIVKATRGPGGGFELGRPASDIRLMAVVEAVDGPFTPVRCLLGRPECLREQCLLGALSDQLNSQVLDFLNGTTVADLAAVANSPGGLAGAVVSAR